MSDLRQHGQTGMKGSARARRGGKSRRTAAVARPNRAQLRAMDARTVTAAPPALDEGTDATTKHFPVAPRVDDMSNPSARRRVSRSRAVARPIALTRDEEYQIIRVDLRRLLLTGGSLLVAMIALLVVLGG